MPFAVVQKKPGPAATGIDEQIQIAIAIDIGQHGPSGELPLASHTGLGGDVLEPPVAQVFVEDIPALQITKIKIAPSVAIHVAGGNARTISQNAVSHGK